MPKNNITIPELEAEVLNARTIMKNRREIELQPVKVKGVKFYHNSITRHNACLFTLENGHQVMKEFRESDWLNIVSTFTRCEDMTVWYDRDNMVRQFVLSHEYS